MVRTKKIAVCGKGGSGKSSVVALLARGLRDRGYETLVVDADDSNPGLHRLLGFGERPTPLLELVGGKKKVFQAFSANSQPPGNILMRQSIKIADIPYPHVVERNHTRLVCIGKILQSLEGCACPMGTLSREFLKRLSLQEGEIVLVDMEAGVEHFGRGIEKNVDSVLCVTEPSFDSLELAGKIDQLAKEIGNKSSYAILNKVASEEIGLTLREELARRDVTVIGSIGYDPGIFQAGLSGDPLCSGKAAGEIERILDQLL